MVGQAEGGELVVAAHVLGDAGGDAGQACFLPRGAVGDADEGLDRRRYTVSVHDAAGAGTVAEAGDSAAVGGAQSLGLIERRVKVGVVAWRQGAGDHLVWNALALVEPVGLALAFGPLMFKG